jgi:DNA (cytosine-5)-methyltransferase 1
VLILSLFPGIGLLDMAFEQEGFCVVRGPDVLWGGDIRTFHPSAGVFDGVIGGPPCQVFSRLVHLGRARGHVPRFDNLIPEFERCVSEAQPRWFLMENLATAPRPLVQGFVVQAETWNNRYFGGEQHRVRAVSFGSRDGQRLCPDVALFEAPYKQISVVGSQGGYSQTESALFSVTGRHAARVAWRAPVAVTAGHGGAPKKGINVYSLEDACELQGLPRDFTDNLPFRKEAKLKAVANGVPLPMGRAIARAVKRAMEE